MRVVVAPDSFGGTLSATAAARAIEAGWRTAAPDDELTLLPLADGGTGFVDVLHAARGGTWHELAVTGPLGDPVDARWLELDGVAYVESAAACGLHLVTDRTPATARRASTRGVGELVADARDAGVTEVVVGLGGSATTDGGAGMLAALGAVALDAAGEPVPDGAPAGAARLTGMPDLGGIALVAAADVDNPLLGPHGAAAVFGPQKGADNAAVAELDGVLARFADLLPRDVRDEPGAGAAGGLGAALLALGARRVSGAGLVRELVGLDAALDAADLAVTGEGSFDWQSLRGKLVTTVARGAADRGIPCLVLAGQVSVGRREAGAAGVDSAYSVAEDAGGVEASMADPAGTLSALAARVARQWSR
ncbi:glycerate kinase [Pseudonocardia sp. KRD-184]|uniref:Glycerate kinase n=1 Tax=Pseudonocardia oceani TaxID=2792013 RepID=A0ABS6U3M8_9PSEU|nr:glycerate kinase [Pseudonocardia oceani]MBW0091927.1 glycerate kinase [Pseudonocardia oceani]MBW0098821.1 glycerate kinase [Pseudonocardia oceani]MBW0111316.1 glycerate kinase [Pseudonocardia oceani]MBW0124277.1 glycerate kinase [Pseudonocardia oceani]MBW0126834.1 glycerate kinase [Pseudonocardia oceani]